MKSGQLATAAALMLLLAQPASAQMNLLGIGDTKPLTQEEIEKREAQEKAYRDSLRKIPEQKAVNDPWGGVREAGSSSAGSKVKPKAR